MHDQCRKISNVEDDITSPVSSPVTGLAESAVGSAVDLAVAAHRGDQGPLLEVLHAVQAELGYVPTEAARLVADRLNLSRADVHGVVTFYHDFRDEPAGRRTGPDLPAPRPARRSAATRWSTRATAGSASTLGAHDQRRRGDARPGVLLRQLRPRPVGRGRRPALRPGRPRRLDALLAMEPAMADQAPVTVYVPRDSAARSVGADEVADRAGRAAGRPGPPGAQRLARHALARAAGRGRHAARAGWPTVRSGRATSTACSTRPARRRRPRRCGSAGPTRSSGCPRQQRVTFARVGVVDPLSPDDYVAHGGPGRAAPGAGDDARSEVVEEVVDVRPARSRRRRLPGRDQVAHGRCRRRVATRKYVCCNADEGDSGTFADRMLIEGDPFSLIEGMAIAAHAVGATRGLRLPPLGVPGRGRDPAPGDRHRLRPRLARASSVLGSGLTLRPARAGRRRRLHLRRGDLDAGEPRGQARGDPGQAADPRAGRACSAGRPSSTTC